jgi:hypothetical protein
LSMPLFEISRATCVSILQIVRVCGASTLVTRGASEPEHLVFIKRLLSTEWGKPYQWAWLVLAVPDVSVQLGYQRLRRRHRRMSGFEDGNFGRLSARTGLSAVSGVRTVGLSVWSGISFVHGGQDAAT